jgi:hypothetical protein
MSQLIKRNMGTIDRALRAIIGIVLISLVFVGPQTPWGWIGVILLATAVFGYCPPYAIFGWSTRGKHETD